MIIWLKNKMSKQELMEKLNIKDSEIMIEDEDLVSIFAESDDYDACFEGMNLSPKEKLNVIEEAMNNDDVNSLILDRVSELAEEYNGKGAE
jgi:hypothetical protein